MGNTHRVSAMHASGEHSTIGWLPASWLPEYMDSALPFLQLRSLTQADLGGQIPAQSHRMGASVTGRSWQKQQGSCWGGRSSCDSPYCAVTLSPAPMPHHHKACWGGGGKEGICLHLPQGRGRAATLCGMCTFVPVPNWGKVVWSAGPAGCGLSAPPSQVGEQQTQPGRERRPGREGLPLSASQRPFESQPCSTGR